MLSFRDYHTLQILEGYSTSKLPLDTFVRDYLKSHKAIGSKDRQSISKNIYFIIRNLSLIDAHLIPPLNWIKRLAWIQANTSIKEGLPLHIQYSCPKWLFDILSLQYEKSYLENILRISNTEAPLTIRVNTTKTDLDSLQKALAEDFQVLPCEQSPWGLKFRKREPVTAHTLYKQGHFEIQDESSQLSCLLPDIQPGHHILDFCAGAGGKSLALAQRLQGKGVIYVHDIRDRAIQEAKKRFERAGIHNVQFFDSKTPLPQQLLGNCDLVFVDVPCTGTGTLRRNPDIKWKLSKSNPLNQAHKLFMRHVAFLI
jgi:16S rRNA C967 or C1407 C5-methylase (RsmB/RsmF family)